MKKIIYPGKKFRLWDYILIPLRVSPVFTGIKILNRIILGLIPSFTVLVTADFIDTAINIFNKKAAYSDIYQPLALFVAIIIYDNLSGAFMDFVHDKYCMKMEEILRSEIVEKRARLKYCFIEDNDTWDLIQRTCDTSVGRITDGLHNLTEGMDIIIRVVSVLAVLMSQVWWAALVVTAMAVPLFFLAIKGGRETYKANKEAEKHNRRAGYYHDVLYSRNYVEERALFGYGPAINEKWYEKYEKARKINLIVDLKYFMRMKSGSLITVLLSMAIIGVMLIPLSAGSLSVGMFIGLVNATLNLVQMMSWQLSGVAKEIANNLEFLKDLTSFYALEEQEGALDLPENSPEIHFESIEFKNVSFRYPGTEKYVLKNCSFKLVKNLHYAFVGVNGAGKTTITKLLTGMYDNFEGEILINGKSIREYRLAELKRLFSVVFQDFSRYYISLKDNVTLGNPHEFNENKIAETLSIVGMDSAVEKLPYGINSYLGKIKDSGVDLSGGEWQRVALARSLYHPGEIRILDESTAALDPVAESEVYKMFGKISAGKSTIFITHRLGATKLADVIIVIDDGKVAESGSHDDLMKRGGLYAQMFESQRSWYN